ncbi:MAG: efflux RND transporter periplasmic adaptor subunit [Candidatus Dormibacteria bacterium]
MARSIKRRTKLARMRWRVPLAAVLAIAALAIAILVVTRPSPALYRVATASNGAVDQVLDCTGTIVPATEAELNFGTSGLVSTVGVSVGMPVTAGSTLATLDTTPLSIGVTAAQAALALAETQLRSARAGTNPLGSEGGGSGSPGGGVSTSQIDELQATVDSDIAQLDQARSALAAASLVSPITGIVAAVTLQSGQTVSASPSSVISPGAATASAEVVVVSSGTQEVVTSVGVAQYALLAVKEKVQVVPAGSASALRGQVASIGLTSTQSNGSTSYPVTIALATGTSEPLGSSADLEISVRHASHAVRVPSSAVHFLGDATVVDELHRDQLVPVPVTVGAVGPTYTQIVRGLRSGTKVVLANLSQKAPSAASKPQGLIGPRVQFFGKGRGGAHSVVVQGGPVSGGS